MEERIQKLRDRFADLEVDAFYVRDEINVRYLTGFTGDSTAALVTAGEVVLISDGRYQEQLAEECPGMGTAIRGPSQRGDDFTAQVLRDCGVKRIAIEADEMSVSALRSLEQRLQNINLVETSSVILNLRMIKDSDEIEILTSAVRVNERALQSVLAKLGTDWTEQEIAYDLEATIRRLGASGFSFDPIVGAGPGGAKPHYQVGLAVVGDYSSLLIDWGTKLGGYASDLTRTFHFENASEKFRSAYQAVLDAQLAAIDAIRPGAAARKIDEAARNVLKNAGLGDYFIHGLGHGIGLQIHESPRLSAVSEDVLQPGMVITVEPGVYFEGEFGIRIEDDVLVTETGHEVLSTIPKGLDDCRLIL